LADDTEHIGHLVWRRFSGV